MYIGYSLDRIELRRIRVEDSSVDLKIYDIPNEQNSLSYLIFKIILVISMSRNSQKVDGFKPINPQFDRPGKVQPQVRISPKLQKDPNNFGQQTSKSKNYPSIEKISLELSTDYAEFQEDFYSPSLGKRFNTDRCSPEKFKRLARNPQTQKYNRTSIDEARAVVQAEMENLVVKPIRPDKITSIKMNLDYQVAGPGSYTHVDIKNPVGSDILTKQGQSVSVSQMSYKIGTKIVRQKARFIGQKNGPLSSENVCHIVDLCYVPKNEKPIVIKNILKGASDAGTDAGIFFINR
jgi:hypothetical protein